MDKDIAYEPLDNGSGIPKRSYEELFPEVENPNEPYHRAFYAIGYITLLISTATCVFHVFEGWSLIDSLYFAVNTSLTVGYGDIHPKHTLMFTTFVLWCAMAGTALIIGFVVATAFESWNAASNFQVESDETPYLKQKSDLRRRFFWSVLYLLFILVLGTLFCYFHEGWSLGMSFYFITVSVSTCGIGDLTIKDPIGRLFLAFYLLFAVTGVSFCLGTFVDLMIRSRILDSRVDNANKALEEVLNVSGTDADGKLDFSGTGEHYLVSAGVSRNAFFRSMLIKGGFVDKTEYDLLRVMYSNSILEQARVGSSQSSDDLITSSAALFRERRSSFDN